ncbi:hypothetical protein EFN49_03515 [Leuconostoc citreum]|uniref:GH36 C-terminal domain-containing protein n=1 Tax=Leuconostoc citreum TaxID=33964 RepID=UPI0021A4E588|nr:GH36 C-terminal domain-containing protein [Leuconostoc citreum]MCT3074778.1 hypothetical protein [Leuconostoc citreum]MDY5162852.1 GH36 C-terminal domain-containing protein [Leuconostoc citreum]MDY5166404.1 GH36 C-terminal domain-containing protein [Leuconostoc citreum]
MSNANFFFDEQQQVFHLSNQQVSYLIQIEDGGVLSHLLPEALYVDQATQESFSGDELMSIGLYNAPIEQADFTSSVRYFKVQENELK